VHLAEIGKLGVDRFFGTTPALRPRRLAGPEADHFGSMRRRCLRQGREIEAKQRKQKLQFHRLFPA
jgi:hypothetical protein